MLKKLKGYMLYMIARSVVTGKSFVRGALCCGVRRSAKTDIN